MAVVAVTAGAGTVIGWGAVSVRDVAPMPDVEPAVGSVIPPVLDLDPTDCDGLSLAERAGLLLVVGLPGVTEVDNPLIDLLAEVGVGGVMLRDENLIDRDQASQLIAGLRLRLGADLLVAVDEEGGRVTSLRALGDRTPSARRLGSSGPDQARAAGVDLAQRAGSVGIDWILAPVVDLDAGPFDGVIGDRSFGDDPAVVADVAAAFADGLRSGGLAITVKHFPGHGGSSDPHAGTVVDDIDRDALLTERLGPFRTLIERGAEAVMVGHVTYPNALGPGPASLEPAAYGLLRATGFDGVAITDALGMGAVHTRWGFDRAPAVAVAAGADAVLVTQGGSAQVLREGLVNAVSTGTLDEGRLDEAVNRVQRLRGAAPTSGSCP
ncbi:MAG: glycoside hydrolase family 3 N-terminal domain-containing protein [Acidimicrobiales bacterium]